MARTTILRLALMAAVAAILIPGKAGASWLSDITGVDINVPAGRLDIHQPHPEHIPQALQNLPKDAINFLNPEGNQMAFFVRQANAQASGSARPMPADIRNVLTPFFPPEILDRARFTTSSQSGLNLASTIMGVNEHVNAVTVDDIIVFRTAQGAADPVLWSHELVHVTQYRNMGVEGFAAMYAGPGFKTIEDDAYAWQGHVQQVLSQGVTIPAPHWSDSTGGAVEPLTWNDFNEAARSVVQPMQCVNTQIVGPGAFQVTNLCPVPISVTGLDSGGVLLPCNGPVCVFPPQSQHVIAGPPVFQGSMVYQFIQ